jgi:glutamyl-tRNA synthetase
VRLQVAPEIVSFDDLVHGAQSFDVAADVGDFVLQRADGVAAYQLAVAIDDARMGMTHVIRGDDLLSSTPRQILVLRAIGASSPLYGHVPLLLGEDGHRLAKRGGSLTLQALRANGVSPEALTGFLARTAGLGEGSPVRAHELIPDFDIRRLPTSPTKVTERDLALLARGRSPQ